MGETCSVCGVPVAGANILYTPDGRIVCPACFAKAPPVGDLAKPPWKMFAIAGAVAGVIPFGVNMSTSSSTMVNGEVTSFVYRDWIAIACGVVAIMLGIIATAAARKEQLQRGLAFAAGIGVVLLGGAQIARGFGVFADPRGGGSGSYTSTSITTSPSMVHVEDDTPKGDPQSPETCPDEESCFQLGRELNKAKDTANAVKAYERACKKGAMGGCFNGGLIYINEDPPDVVKAMPMFQKACDQNDLQACTNLGRIYATDGPTKNPAEAIRTLNVACVAGSPVGCHYYGVVLDQAIDGNEAPDKARMAFEMGCKGNEKDPGVGDSCFYLGEMKRRGIGGDKDAKGALAAYTDGCKLGNQDACKALEAPAEEPAKAAKPTKKTATKKKRR